MMQQELRGWRSPLVLVALGAMVLGCSETDAEDLTAAVSEALEQSSNSTDSVELSGLMRGPQGLAREAAEGFHCDASPDVTYVSICGKDLPATVHLEWTNCAAPRRHGGRGGPMGPGPLGEGPTGRGDMIGMAGMHGAGMPDGGGACQGGGRGDAGASSGTVDIVHSYTASDDCEAAIQGEQKVTFQVKRSRADGNVFSVAGTTVSTSVFVVGAAPTSKTTSVDVTRTVTSAAGELVRSVHLTGSRQVEFSQETPPTRTVDETVTAEHSDGTKSTVTLTDVVFPPRNVCGWPTSGTLVRTGADGAVQTLVYGPECGDATLDGEAIELQGPGRGPGAGEGRRGGGMGAGGGRMGPGAGGTGDGACR